MLPSSSRAALLRHCLTRYLSHGRTPFLCIGCSVTSNGGAAILMQMRLVFIANFYGPSSRFKWGVRGAYPLCIWPTASDI